MPEPKILRRVKRAVIKEEYVAITGDVSEAVLLNQMIYWSERVADFDKFIVEEKQHMIEIGEKATEYPLICGWIHKSAAEIKEETMSVESQKTIARKMQNLVEKAFLLRRNNPKSGYDRIHRQRPSLWDLHGYRRSREASSGAEASGGRRHRRTVFARASDPRTQVHCGLLAAPTMTHRTARRCVRRRSAS